MGEPELSVADLMGTTRALHHVPAGLSGTGFLVAHQGRSWLVTARVVADSATLLVVGPDDDRLELRKQRKLWTSLPRGGVAVMPFAGVAIIDLGVPTSAAMAARSQVFGYDGRGEGLCAGAVIDLPLSQSSDGLAVGPGLPFGYVGGPVVISAAGGAGVICVGLALPGRERDPVASLEVVLATIAHALG